MLLNVPRMDSKSIRKFVSKNPYENPGSRDKEENHTMRKSIPYSELYYRMCQEGAHPPTQKEYASLFMEICKSEISGKKEEEAVRKRVERNWSTFTMELEFYCQVRDSKLFDKAEIDTELDVELGYDLIVIDETNEHFDVVPVHLFFATERERRWQPKKEKRKKGKPGGIEYGLMPSWKSSHPKETVPNIPGDRNGYNMHLYTQEHVRELRERLNKWKDNPTLVPKILLESSNQIESSDVYKKYLNPSKRADWYLKR